MYNLDQTTSILLIIVFILAYKYIKLFLKVKKVEYEFTSIVNHTFRTPLTRIMWITKELEKDLPINEKLNQLQNLNNANSKLLEIVDLIAGIKNIKNTNGYFFEATSIRDIIEKSINKYREEINKKNIIFELNSFKEIPLLTVDLKKISFVIDTLIENAILYTQPNGKIEIKSSFNRKNLSIEIIDNGMGLTFKEKIEIFSKFYRSKRATLANPDGMGLRLYLSKQIIKRHHGEIYAKSKGKNKGTKFFLRIPMKR